MNCLFKRGVAMALLFFCLAASTHAQSLMWRADSIESDAVGDWRQVRYVIPRDHDPSSRRLPVLYLLHGLTGDESNWTERTRMIEYLDQLDLKVIVVMPDVDNSWYQNDTDGRRFFDFVSDELPDWAYRQLGADTTRQSVAGLSMGGYGALLLGFSSPKSYQVVGSFSGAIVYPSSLANLTAAPDSQNVGMWSLWKAFGDPAHPNRNSGDLYGLLETAQDTLRPYVVLRHGIQDGYKDFLPGHRKLAGQLSAMGWPYEYHEMPGGHSWPFWDASIKDFLSILKENLESDGMR